MIPHAALLATILPAGIGLMIYILQRYIEEKARWISTAAAASSIILILSMTQPLLDGYNNGRNPVIYTYPWITPIDINFGFLIDMVSFPIGLIIAIVSTLSCLYSVKYMEKEPGQASYYANLLIFMTGMIGVVFSINLIQFYLFWELMLIPSYLLISQWGTSRRRLSIGFKYFIFTHMGALLMLLGILSLFSYTTTFDLTELPSQASSIPPDMAPVIFTLLLLGFFVKMAAFPLHTWLPDAHSEAPTPISAMLSGVMLKCGAYGIGRILLTIFGQRLEQSSDYLLALAIITMVYGGLMALAQTDIKRLLAYSSISQMGYIIFGFATVSTLGIMGSLLHIVNHAICKALLFMCAGSIIHQTGTRNIQKMSGLIAKMPVTCLAGLIGIFSLAGTPPLNAFWSEWMIFGGGLASRKIAFAFIAVASTMITAGYLLWFAWRVFFGSVPKSLQAVEESPPLLLAPVIILASASIILGIWPGIFLEFITPAAEILSSLLGAG
ncbi:MAG: NADH-quinone oxidoreductase subunit M [Candidatus Bathyarchaeota archaeon]|nr:NADH-quinone oxidoreductase subunit M [Candidatus Bathyarchaeota archaeon]